MGSHQPTLQISAPDCGEHSYAGLGRLQERVALITAGDTGVGRALAIAFAREGADIVICRPEGIDNLRDTISWIELTGRSAQVLCADFFQADADFDRFLQMAYAAFGRLDIVANMGRRQPDGWSALRDIYPMKPQQLLAVAQAANAILTTGSAIINFLAQSSTSLARTFIGEIAQLTAELGGVFIERGVHLNTIATGPIYAGPASSLTPIVTAEDIRGAIQPTDIALASVFLASDEAATFYGSILELDESRLVH
jgi:NAD(P)-dependent dehydrogenase (short-subunit alcohol dehydrogenase family)